MAAHQAPPSLGFSRQEYWSGLPFPSPMHERKKYWISEIHDLSSFMVMLSKPLFTSCAIIVLYCIEVAQSCPTLCDPIDSSLSGSSIHGIFQAGVLEWIAISFSRGSSWPRDWSHILCISFIGRQILYHCATWETPGYSWWGRRRVGHNLATKQKQQQTS